MAENSGLLILVGAATPPGRLAAALGVAAETVRAQHGDAVDILNLADTPIEICDGRPLDFVMPTLPQGRSRSQSAGHTPGRLRLRSSICVIAT